MSLPDPIRQFLAEPRFATIATLDSDGAPHQAVVWYLLEDDTLLVNSRRERRWPQNLLRDPRIALAVYERDEPEHWVGVRGTAELLRDGDAATADIMAMARRYGTDPDRYRGQDRVTFRVQLERTFEYRG